MRKTTPVVTTPTILAARGRDSQKAKKNARLTVRTLFNNFLAQNKNVELMDGILTLYWIIFHPHPPPHKKEQTKQNIQQRKRCSQTSSAVESRKEATTCV